MRCPPMMRVSALETTAEAMLLCGSTVVTAPLGSSTCGAGAPSGTRTAKLASRGLPADAESTLGIVAVKPNPCFATSMPAHDPLLASLALGPGANTHTLERAGTIHARAVEP